MRIATFELERGQSLWEHHVEINLSESGVHPITLRELGDLGLDLDELLERPLEYVQTNGTPELRQAIAGHYPGATAEHIEVTNGTSEANYLLLHALLEPGDHVVLQIPNYFQVPGIAESLGAEVDTFPLLAENDWRPDLDQLEAALRPDTRVVYLSYPNNPTGALLEREERERIVAAVDRVGATLIADEVYRGAEHDGRESESFWGLSENVVVTCGLSKAYGIPGARIGWLVASPELVERCWTYHDYTTIAPSALSDTIARFAVEEPQRTRLLTRARSFMNRNRDRFERFLDDLDGLIRYTPPRAGAYAFSHYDLDIPSIELCEHLRKKLDVLIVPGAWMGVENTLRFGLGPPPEDFDRGLVRVAEELKRLRAR